MYDPVGERPAIKGIARERLRDTDELDVQPVGGHSAAPMAEASLMASRRVIAFIFLIAY